MEIVRKAVLAETQDTKITKIEVKSPLIAGKAKPGQFVVLMAKEKGERIPLTVVESDKTAGIITLIFQEVGLTTRLLGKLNAGDSLYALVGPLGHKTELQKYGHVILIGGGVGIAEIYPVAKALKAAGNYIITVLGARTRDLLILEDELKKASDEIFITTDDGSYGRKGFATDVLKELLIAPTSLRAPLEIKFLTGRGREAPEAISSEGMAQPVASEAKQALSAPRNDRDRYDLVYAVGPIPMMKAVSSVTKPFKVKTVTSLNALMVDGTGMCGCCRVTVGNEVKFSCMDGPEFDGHLVNWEELEKRTKMYCKQEDHACRLDK